MKKLKLFTTVISFCLFQQFAFACTCAPTFSFCEGIGLISPDSSLYAELILRGKITDVITGIDVEVEEVLRGEINQSTIPVWPTDCTIYTDPLEEGYEYIFAVRKFEDKFLLLDCLISYLKIEDEIVTGNISSGIESLDYLEFKNLENCVNELSTPVENDLSIENSLSVFPNPTIDILTIQNSNNQNFDEDVQMELIDMVGKKLQIFKKEDGILVGETWSINLQNFSSGVYFLKLTANNQENIIRIVKE